MAAFAGIIASPALAQQQERTLDEIRTEAIHRAEVGGYPLIGLDPGDVREAFQSIHSRDKDEWAEAFMGVAGRYMAEGESLRQTQPAKADTDFIRAWRLYSFGRWPVPVSAKKQESYQKAIQAYLAHARFLDPPLQVIRIPFERKEIIGYMRLPRSASATAPVPIVIAINGLDSRKEDLSESFGAILPYGIGYIAIDGPGTGQSPVKASPTANRAISAVIDYLQTRPEIEKTRIAIHGVSWGAYWGTKMAVLERARLRCVSVQSPPTDLFFQKTFVENSLLGNREYLFDQVPALMSIFDNITTMDQLVDMFQHMSLVNEKILGQPTTRMLVIGGARDTQVPISDVYALLTAGDVPKYAWINPQGGHLGRQVGVWPDPRIFGEVILPWLSSQLKPDGVKP
ncbi:MAG TPA: alpha/beta hydrolase [Acidobacteriaceae bacterium]|jgi:pimeloyl-ACP methyl ester carboxylesterase|nr:alpha/beta hydrolase [Acidobacteriaceae bacterium]